MGPGKRFSTGNRVADYILGNWQINSVFTWRNGQPFNVSDSSDAANTGVGTTTNAPTWLETSITGPIPKRNGSTRQAMRSPAQYTYGNSYTNDQRIKDGSISTHPSFARSPSGAKSNFSSVPNHSTS